MSAMDKLKNTVQEQSGKAKAAVGDATDDRDLQAQGEKDQVAGDLKNRGEHLKDAFKG